MKAAFIGGDPLTTDLATLALKIRWPDVTQLIATTGAEGLELVERESPDLVMVHHDYTDMTLATTIRQLRRFNNVPLLILEHQGNEMEMAIALETGADHCVQLPCDLTEVVLRIWALLRRVGLPSYPQDAGSLAHHRTPVMAGRE